VDVSVVVSAAGRRHFHLGDHSSTADSDDETSAHVPNSSPDDQGKDAMMTVDCIRDALVNFNPSCWRRVELSRREQMMLRLFDNPPFGLEQVFADYLVLNEDPNLTLHLVRSNANRSLGFLGNDLTIETWFMLMARYAKADVVGIFCTEVRSLSDDEGEDEDYGADTVSDTEVRDEDGEAQVASDDAAGEEDPVAEDPARPSDKPLMWILAFDEYHQPDFGLSEALGVAVGLMGCRWPDPVYLLIDRLGLDPASPEEIEQFRAGFGTSM
jgi:hypothetical protein